MESEYKIDPIIEEQLIKNPYNTIKEWAEARLKKVGDKIYQFLALQPVSLIAPDIPWRESSVRTNINLLILGPPGSGKTSALLMLRDTTINPFMFQSVTEAKMSLELSGKDNLSLICTDVDIIFRDPELIKMLEGALGEEHSIARFNMRTSINSEVNSVFTGAGLPGSIRENIKHGFLQRTKPIVIFHTKDEQMEIGRWINNGMFNQDYKTSFVDIKNYYKKISDIQKNHNDDFRKIDGYHVTQKIKDELERKWKSIMELPFPEDHYLNRELHSIYQYLCCSAILNIFNREIVTQDGKRFIVPNNQDIELAKSLFNTEMRTKFHILKLNQMINNVKNHHIISFYDRIKDDDNLSFEYKQIGKIFAEQKLGKGIKEKSKIEQ